MQLIRRLRQAGDAQLRRNVANCDQLDKLKLAEVSKQTAQLYSQLVSVESTYDGGRQ